MDFSKADVDAIARALLGEPNRRLSKPTELRFGNNGSVSVELDRGIFHDHENGEGGGMIALVERTKGLHGRDAVDWIKALGIEVDGAHPARANGNGASHANGNGTGNHVEKEDRGEITATFDYVDEDGALLFQVCRIEFSDTTPEGKRRKKFLQRRPDQGARGGWSWKVQGTRQVPYCLPELRKSVEAGYLVFIAEGEKACGALHSIGVPATCNAGGAGKWPESLTEHFSGADVVILPDNDDAGREHGELVARSLRGTAARIRILDLPGLGRKEDAFEWVERGNDAGALIDALEAFGRDWQPFFKSRYGRLAWADLDKPGPEVEFLIDDFLTAGDKAVIGGPSQSGKSFLAIHAALSIARGVPFFGRPVKKGLVVYQAGEGARGIKKRLRAYRQHFGVAPSEYVPFELLQSPVNLWKADGDTGPLIEEIKALAELHQGAPLAAIFIDTLATAMAGADEISFKDMGAVMENIDRLRNATGAHVCLVHHMNAGGQRLRGHSSLYAGLDQAIFVTCDPKTKRRTVSLDKCKDDENGINFQFDLACIETGARPDGKPITSCVCVDPGTKDQVYEENAKKKGFRPSEGEALVMRALLSALEKNGEQAPSDLGLPLGTRVVLGRHWREELDAIAPWHDGDESEDGKKRRDARTKKAFERAGQALLRYRVIGRANPYAWLTGRPVAGFAETYPGGGYDVADRLPDRTEPRNDVSALDDDINFFG